MTFLGASPFIAIHEIYLAPVLRYIIILAIARDNRNKNIVKRSVYP